MSDIFISYASSDRERARLLAEALARRGWTVWWDREIPFGESFDRVIERELAGARSVIVLWSRVSVDSDWVRNEARQGLKRDVLIPAQIDAVDLPLEFSNVQTADLTDWRPDKPHAEFDRLVQRLKVLLGEPTAVASPAPRPPEREPSPAHRPDASVSWQGPERRKRGKRAAWLLALLALLAVIGGGGYWIISQSYAEVPSLVGMRPSAAEKVLIDAGLKLGPPTSAESAETPPGTILSQSPESRTRVAKGSIVNVVVAVRPKVALPKLGALPLEQAQETLKAAGLAVGRVSYRRTEAAQPGTVIEQGPTAGEKVELGVAVDLVVAAAVESEVPNLASLPFSKARAALERAGLRVGSRKTASLMPGGETAEAVVRSQSPPAGAHVPPGSRIDLVVDEPGVPVPAVTKVTLDEAKATVERSGLALGAVKLAPDPNVKPGIVIGQSLRPADLVAKGARVDLTVAASPSAPTPRVSERDYDTVQKIYGSHKTSTDCREIRGIAEKLTAYFRNTNLVPSDAAATVIYPKKVEQPSIGDLARDRQQRIQNARRDCFDGAVLSGEDSVTVVGATPTTRSILRSGAAVEIAFEVSYALRSRDQAQLVISLSQSPVSRQRCNTKDGSLVTTGSARIRRGEGRVTVRVTWQGGSDKGGRLTEGYLAPAPSLWEADRRERIRYFGVDPLYCWRFAP